MKKIELLHFTVAKKNDNCVSSNWFPAKSVEQSRVEQSQFEQFTPTQVNNNKQILPLKYIWCSWCCLMGSWIMGSIGWWDKIYPDWQAPNYSFIPDVYSSSFAFYYHLSVDYCNQLSLLVCPKVILSSGFQRTSCSVGRYQGFLLSYIYRKLYFRSRCLLIWQTHKPNLT